MKITLYVLLATLTIYCNSSVLSLPPSLIVAAASTERHHANPSRDKRGFVPPSEAAAAATAAAADGTDHLLQQLNALTDAPLPPPGPPPSYDRQTVRYKKEARLQLNEGNNIAANDYSDKNTDTNSDDIKRLSSFGLSNSNNAGFYMTHPNKLNGILAAAAAATEALDERHEDSGGSDGKDDSRQHNNIQDFGRKLLPENDLNALLSNDVERQGLQQPRSSHWPHVHGANAAAPQIRAMLMKKFFTPLTYWMRQCQPTDNNCLQKYYRTLQADRSRAAAAAAKQMDAFTAHGGAEAQAQDDNMDANENAAADDDEDINSSRNAHIYAFGADHNSERGGGGGGYPLGNFNDDADIDSGVYKIADITTKMDGNKGGGSGGHHDQFDEDNNANNDILMLLSGEQNVMKFLSWAMSHLYPYQHFANMSGAAEYYHPGMYNWKKLNLSGRLEPPLVVEEPHYVIVRREQLDEDMRQDIQYKGDPFIPPRGRKHNMPDLDALLNRYETFVPNRGKRDKIKDIFKYDDLFFPNRGKKQKPSKLTISPLSNSIGGGQRQRNCDDTRKVCDDTLQRYDNEGGSFLQSIENQIDESDDSNLTRTPPVAIAMRRMLSVLEKHLRARKPYMSWARKEQDDSARNGGMTLGINFDKNSDDNLSNNYSDTIDSDIFVDGDSKGEDYNEEDDIVASLAGPAWISVSDGGDAMLTGNTNNENDQSVKSSIPQTSTSLNTFNDNEDEAAMTARMRRVFGTFGAAARFAANSLRSPPTSAQHQSQQQQQQQQRAFLQPTKAMLHYLNRHLKRAQEPHAATSSQMYLPSNQVRGNSNDLDMSPLRQLQPIQQLQQQRQLQQKRVYNNNKPLLTVQHLPLAWLQHMSSMQMPQLQLQQNHQLTGGIDGVAVGRNPPEATTAKIDRIYDNI